MNKIAIQGHSERGKDVIQILKSLGGNDVFGLSGEREDCYYFINDAKCINYCIKNKKLMSSFSTHTFYTLEEYEQIFNNMENKRTIQIDITTAKEWYKQGGDLRKIALQAFIEKELQSLPKSWEEYCEIFPNIIPEEEFFHLRGQAEAVTSKKLPRNTNAGVFPSKKRAEQFLTLNKLLQIRDYYNNGWEPNWANIKQMKYVIGVTHNKLFIDEFLNLSHVFAFKSRELANEFFDNFKEDLAFIKEFL